MADYQILYNMWAGVSSKVEIVDDETTLLLPLTRLPNVLQGNTCVPAVTEHLHFAESSVVFTTKEGPLYINDLVTAVDR